LFLAGHVTKKGQQKAARRGYSLFPTALEVFASAATNFKVMRVERHFGRLGKGMMDSAHRAISANLHFDKTPARLPCLDGTVVRPVSLVQSHVEFLSPLGRWAKAKRFSPVG
jgi:hypothetical protein